MPTSVATGAPRLADIRRDSSPSIHIDREITVVSSAADGSLYGTTPTVTAHARASSQGPAPLRRWNSKLSDVGSNRPGARTMSMRDTRTFDSNRDSMKALSDFLMRNEPPPGNYMSRPDSDAGSLRSIKKSAFKIFGRHKSKQSSKGPRFMQLPDSAVAAKTTGGARHIAISIPLEYDHPDHGDSPTSLMQSLPSSRPSSQQRMAQDRGAVTILKPVAELRESGSFGNAIDGEDASKRDSQAESFITPAAELLGAETTRTLENYYTQLHRQQRSTPKSAVAESKTAVRQEPSRTQKSYVAVNPVDINRQDSTRSDPRHSGGTAYSTTSMGTSQGHSQVPSSASSAPSGTSMKHDLPRRSSSITKIPPSMEAELAKSYLAKKPLPNIENPARESFMSEKSYQTSHTAQTATSAAESTASQSPPTVFSTAETAQMHHAAAAIQTISSRSNSRSNTPKHLPLNPPPNRELPDVPESPCIPSFLPSPNGSKRNSPTISIIAEAPRPKSTSSTASSQSSSQSRQDRVKARKQRDMALHKEKETCRPALSSRSSNPQITVTPVPSSQRTKRRSMSADPARKRGTNFNSISEIMLVANLAPYTGEVRLEDLPLAPVSSGVKGKGKRDSDSNGNISGVTPQTPPSSTLSSASEADAPSVPRVKKTHSLETRRQERRVKRDLTLREKEVDIRLAKVERDNAVLLSTLGGIASSFGELSRALPGVRGRTVVGLLEREIRNGADEGEKMREDEGRDEVSLEALGRGDDS